jgi:hypothetical protein
MSRKKNIFCNRVPSSNYTPAGSKSCQQNESSLMFMFGFQFCRLEGVGFRVMHQRQQEHILLLIVPINHIDKTVP